MAETLKLAGQRVEVGEGWTVVRIGHLAVNGAPQGTEGQAETARALGYGDDVTRMNRDHEVLHALLASWARLPASPTLARVAGHIVPKDEDLERAEEAAVLALQRWLLMVGRDVLELARGYSE
jgi:hypothetical protein